MTSTRSTTPTADPFPDAVGGRGPGAVFVGREAELALASSALDAAADGEPSGLVVLGATGAGRTSVAAAIAALARSRDALVVTFQALAPRLPLLFASHLADALELGERSDATGTGLVRLVRSELDALAARRRLVTVIVDDLHRCSLEDLALIRDLALRPPAGPFVLVLTAPRGTSLTGDAAALIADLRGDDGFALVDLPPLSPAEIEALISAQPELESRTDTFTRDLVELTGGNPLNARSMIDELLRLAAPDRAQILLGARALTTVHAPDRIRERLAPELDRLSDAEWRVVRALAVWRAAATVQDVSRLTELDPDETLRAAVRLEERGLVVTEDGQAPVRLLLRDPMVALIALDGTAALARQRLHDRAAELVDHAHAGRDDESSLTAAEHFVRGSSEIDESRMETIMRAARWLNATSRYAQSRDLLTRLMARMASEQHVDRLPEGAYALLAEASSRLGEWRDAEQVIASARPMMRDPDARARILMRAARDHVSANHDAEALRLYRTLLDDPDLTPLLRLRAAEDAGRVADNLGYHDEARRLARQAAEDAEQLGELELASDIWVSYHSLLHYAGEPRAALERARYALQLARQSGSERAVARASMGIGNSLADIAPLPRSLRWLRRSMQRAQHAGDSASLGWVSARIAQAYQEAGRWNEARAAARLAVQTDLALHRERALAGSRTTLSILESLRGRPAEAALQLELAVHGQHDDTNPRRGVAYALAACELAWSRGDVEQAVQRVNEAERLLVDETPTRRRTLLFEVYPRLVAVHVAAGDHDGALRGVRAYDDCVATIPEGAAPLFEMQALAVRAEGAAAEGRDADAIAAFTAAARAFTAGGYRWRAARALHRAGTLLAPTDRDAGSRTLSESFELLREMGAEPELEVVRREIHRLGRRPPRAHRTDRRELTPRESQVLRLAAQGLRDAEIARMLWVSHRTVTTHMHNTLRKLGLRSRHELAGWLAANDAAAGGTV